ncbi:MAG: putative endonuclease [Paraglaciecola sp.]
MNILLSFIWSCRLKTLYYTTWFSHYVTQWYTYIVENKLGQYYTGICTDVKRRFSEHQSSGPKCAKALKGKGPLVLKLWSVVGNRSEALKIEIWIKKLSKSNKIKLVNNDFCDAPILNMLGKDEGHEK